MLMLHFLHVSILISMRQFSDANALHVHASAVTTDLRSLLYAMVIRQQYEAFLVRSTCQNDVVQSALKQQSTGIRRDICDRVSILSKEML
jgi:hypothetical protein